MASVFSSIYKGPYLQDLQQGCEPLAFQTAIFNASIESFQPSLSESV